LELDSRKRYPFIRGWADRCSNIRRDRVLNEMKLRMANQDSLSARVSTDWMDPQWDEYLSRVPLGQFQQSSLWARAKKIEGWEPTRVLFLSNDQIAGGFQVLSRRARFGGRIGYVSKGPVPSLESNEMTEFAVRQLLDITRDRNLAVITVQPPDRSVLLSGLLTQNGFLPNRLLGVLTANLVIDLSPGIKEIETRMRPHTRQEIRQAVRRGVKIREGDDADLAAFFRLMLATCQRQQTEPNPGSEAALREMWIALHAGGHVRLSFAEYGGEAVAGLFSIPFGKRVTFWKKGWSGEHRDLHPNQLLFWEAIEWSASNGFESCDFAGMDVRLARAILSGETLTEEMRRTRDFFNLGFGGCPTILPEAFVYLSHPVFRLIYKGLASGFFAGASRRFRRFIRTLFRSMGSSRDSGGFGLGFQGVAKHSGQIP
jgi:peptidoglycan pentaglycine glycine transferase (the first glycine)